MPKKKRIAWNKGKKGLTKGWNKGLTKETDDRVKQYGISGSETKKKNPQIAWNKGLTKDTDERVATYSNKLVDARKGKTWEEIFGIERAKRMKENMSVSRKGKSSGMKGKKVSEVTREKLSNSLRGRHNFNKPLESSIEKAVREILIDMKMDFEQEKYFKGIGTADFYIPSYNFVVECDGFYWHSSDKQKQKDQQRDKKFIAAGIRTLRLPEELIQKDKRLTRESLSSFISMYNWFSDISGV